MPTRIEKTEKIARVKVNESTCNTSMAAIVVKGGIPISFGFNKKGYRGSSIHAEVDALNKLRWQKRGAKDSDIYVYRFLADGGYGIAKPCDKCIKTIRSSGVKRIFYSDYEGIMKILKVSDLF